MIIWDDRDWTRVGPIQGKHPTNCNITLVPTVRISIFQKISTRLSSYNVTCVTVLINEEIEVILQFSYKVIQSLLPSSNAYPGSLSQTIRKSQWIIWIRTCFYGSYGLQSNCPPLINISWARRKLSLFSLSQMKNYKKITIIASH